MPSEQDRPLAATTLSAKERMHHQPVALHLSEDQQLQSGGTKIFA